MHKKTIAAAALVLVMFAYPSSSQIVQPEMTHFRISDVSATHNDDGRVVRRVNGATIGMIQVEWPAGTRTVAHNHANELVVYLVEGRLKAFSGGEEVTLEPGDVAVFPAYVDHAYEALEDSVTIEAAGPG